MYGKTSMNKHLIALLCAGFAVSAGGAAAEAVDPEAKAKEICAACHGEDGNASITPDTPMLGGQPADYLAKALRDYKSGARKHPVMGAMAAGLSAEEITALSRYFARQKSQLFVRY